MRSFPCCCLASFLLAVAYNPLAAADAVPATYPPAATLEQVLSAVEHAPKDHPRLLANAADFERLRESVLQHERQRALSEAVRRHADLLLDVPPITRTQQGRRLLGQSRRCVQRMIVLSMAYQLSGELKYAHRGQKEMLTVAAFSDWNPSHFLDVAEMAMGMAVGYDWLFETMDTDTRRTIRDALLEKAIRLPFETKHRGWVRASNNWGQVCHGGLAAAALAVLEDEPEWAAKTVHNALQNVTRSMAAFAPNGSYPEGPGYWAYGTSYNVVLIAAIESVLGSDFGLSQAPGFSLTGQYPNLVLGPSGLSFNYADGGAGRSAQSCLFWFARRYQRPDWCLGEYDRTLNALQSVSSRTAGSGSDRLLPLVLLWWNPAQEINQIQMPLNWQSEGETPICVHRTSWTDPNATFVGLKSGSPSASHGQMDVGSFVLDADGVRWGTDLGAEGYHGIESRGMDLWSRAQNSDRWTIFRQCNAGHNTLVIDGQLQNAAGKSHVIAFSDRDEFPHSIIDMTDVYKGQAKQVRRGVALLPSGQVLVQDELGGLSAGSEVRWGMITPGVITRREAETAQLAQEDASLTLTILTPQAAMWREINTASPRNEWDSPNRGTRMAAFQAVAPPSGKLTLTVLLTPGSCDRPLGGDGLSRPLDAWGEKVQQ